jgi:methylated-DNA-[protein]-cysteine S-methyltransferase
MKSDAQALETALRNSGATEFQIAVYLATAEIPRGETRSYLDIAKKLGKPGAVRAVGSALKRNPFPGDRIPCHRVIRKNGSTIGFFGSTDPNSVENETKRRLLREEGAFL